MKALILAGGLGTRLREVVGDRPKSMAPIAGKPFLEHQIHFLREQGIQEIVLAVGYEANMIKSYFGEGVGHDVDITYSEEETPLGTAGAIKHAQKYLGENPFYVLNGDTFSQIDLKDFLRFHKKEKSKASIALAKSIDSSNYGGICLEGKLVKDFREKKEGENLVNRGIYIFGQELFERIKNGKNVSLEMEILPQLSKERELKGYFCKGYFMDIGRPETYSLFKKEFMKKLFLRDKKDIATAMNKIHENKTGVILVVDSSRKLLGVATLRGIERFLRERKGTVDNKISDAMFENPKVIVRAGEDEKSIREKISSGVNILPVLDEQERLKDILFKGDQIERKNFPIIRGKAPLRISLAGGGTDFPDYFEKKGGVVINTTINKYSRGTIIKRPDNTIIINSDLGKELVLQKGSLKYDGRFDIIKAVIKLINPISGFELFLDEDIPPGRGLGSSASLSVLVASLMGQMENTKYDDSRIAQIAYQAEVEELKIRGGIQDQYATVTGGFNFIEFTKENIIPVPLRLKRDIIDELRAHLSLCYTGGEHFSGDIHQEMKNSFNKKKKKRGQNLERMKRIAVEIKESLLTGELERIGILLHESWIYKRGLSSSVSNSRIDLLYEAGLKNGANGGKLLGAGGAGYLLFFHPPKKKNELSRAIKDLGGEFLDFEFDPEGIRTWAVRTN